MKIGILTYAFVPNFGANLQAFSTISYLKNKDIEPVLINWQPYDINDTYGELTNQYKMHFDFIRSSIPQTKLCKTDLDIIKVIDDEGIEGIIVGSDAVLQDHPFLKRFHFPTKKFFRIDKVTQERRYPNAFWGSFYNKMKKQIPMAIMSASSQNTYYWYIKFSKRKKISEDLKNFKYVSVRDTWTQKMLRYLTYGKINSKITPDPVFGFNKNAGEKIKTKDEILEKYGLPDKYILVSFRSESLIKAKWMSRWLSELNNYSKSKKLACVALPMPTGVGYKHDFDYEILPLLAPLDWYALIKYSHGYVGENMHPIIVALHNSVPLFCFDTYGVTFLWKTICMPKSSKIHHILTEFNLLKNRTTANFRFFQPPKAMKVIELLLNFDNEKCKTLSVKYTDRYNLMMNELLESINI